MPDHPDATLSDLFNHTLQRGQESNLRMASTRFYSNRVLLWLDNRPCLTFADCVLHLHVVQDASEHSISNLGFCYFYNVVVAELVTLSRCCLLSKRNINPDNPCSKINVMLGVVFVIVVVEHADLDWRRRL